MDESSSGCLNPTISKSTMPSTASLNRIPTAIWVLGFVSMLMDISSQMIHSLLPMFLMGALGASAFAVGIIEGLAESTALIVKVFSGVLSDYIGKRKGLAVFGYALGAIRVLARQVRMDGQFPRLHSIS